MQPETLPHDLEEEILSHLPTKIFAPFRSVCKRWNTLFKKRRFFNSDLGLARPQFILLAESKICSVDANLDGPSIQVYNLPSDIPGYKLTMPMTVEYCDGLIIYVTYKGIGICNPWLRQIEWIRPNDIQCRSFNGMGYDNSRPDKHYKIFASYHSTTTVKANVTEFGTNAWKEYEFASDKWDLHRSLFGVSLNGILYWVAFNRESREHFIQSFDFSTERFKPYCILPTKNAHHPPDPRSLAVFREDRFSFLEQNYNTRNIEIWVTKEKVKNGDGEAAEWVNLMSVLVPEWSSLGVSYYPPSYFVDEDKSLSLVICCYNKKGKAYIYIAKGDKFHEIEIKELVEYHPRHRTYFPNLVQVPFTMSGRGITKNQVESRFALPRGVEVSVGVGGDEWDDGFFDNVKKVIVDLDFFGKAVVYVKFYYCNGNAVVAGAAHGDATETRGFVVPDDDYIEVVEGTYTESRITSITFRTHKGKMSLLYGLFDGIPFVLGGRGSKIIGFYGRSSDVHLTALGVHLSASP